MQTDLFSFQIFQVCAICYLLLVISVRTLRIYLQTFRNVLPVAGVDNQSTRVTPTLTHGVHWSSTAGFAVRMARLTDAVLVHVLSHWTLVDAVRSIGCISATVTFVWSLAKRTPEILQSDIQNPFLRKQTSSKTERVMDFDLGPYLSVRMIQSRLGGITASVKATRGA